MIVQTAYGPAAVHGRRSRARPRVVLLHGAGSSTAVPVLLALQDALGVGTLRLDQPYVVAGRRVPPPAAALDAALDVVLDRLGGPVVLVGRSSGGRVACRAAARRDDVVAVAALSFPLVPPRGASRASELAGAGVPVLVVQGTSDAFGGAAEVAGLALAHVEVHAVAGADHDLGTRRADGRAAGEAAAEAVAVVARWVALA